MENPQRTKGPLLPRVICMPAQFFCQTPQSSDIWPNARHQILEAQHFSRNLWENMCDEAKGKGSRWKLAMSLGPIKIGIWDLGDLLGFYNKVLTNKNQNSPKNHTSWPINCADSRWLPPSPLGTLKSLRDRRMAEAAPSWTVPGRGHAPGWMGNDVDASCKIKTVKN